MTHTDAKCIRREDGDYAACPYDHKRPLGVWLWPDGHWHAPPLAEALTVPRAVSSVKTTFCRLHLLSSATDVDCYAYAHDPKPQRKTACPLLFCNRDDTGGEVSLGLDEFYTLMQVFVSTSKLIVKKKNW